MHNITDTENLQKSTLQDVLSRFKREGFLRTSSHSLAEILCAGEKLEEQFLAHFKERGFHQEMVRRYFYAIWEFCSSSEEEGFDPTRPDWQAALEINGIDVYVPSNQAGNYIAFTKQALPNLIVLFFENEDKEASAAQNNTSMYVIDCTSHFAPHTFLTEFEFADSKVGFLKEYQSRMGEDKVLELNLDYDNE